LKQKRAILGNIQFVGNLLKVGILAGKVFLGIAQDLIQRGSDFTLE
jgi:hypothetical protein